MLNTDYSLEPTFILTLNPKPLQDIFPPEKKEKESFVSLSFTIRKHLGWLARLSWQVYQFYPYGPTGDLFLVFETFPKLIYFHAKTCEKFFSPVCVLDNICANNSSLSLSLIYSGIIIFARFF